MARESALWQRLKGATAKLRKGGIPCDLQRLENAIAVGHPDVEGCIQGNQIWIELKSEDRPKRATTPIKPKLRPSQSIWHGARTGAGSTCHWVLLQVGELASARLYLVAGNLYDQLVSATESELDLLCSIDPAATPGEVLLRAARGW